MIISKILLVAVANGLVTAWPEPTAAAAYRDPRPVNCAKVTGALGALKKIGPPATSFCSSFLKIRTQTITTTVTPATMTRTTSTTTVTTTKASCDQQKRDGPLEYRAFDPADSDAAEGLEKRHDFHHLLAGYGAAKISEGCKCLSLQPKTKTVTKTAATPTTDVVATATQCAVKICHPNGVGQSCAQDSDCCLGACGVQFGVPTCCTPNGAECNLNNPGTCCNAACRSNGLGSFQGTCIG